MDADRWQEITRVYSAVVARAPHERADALVALCGNDPALRREIESLLEDSSEHPMVLDRPPWDMAAGVVDPNVHLTPGTVVGPYRVTGLLGVGGMGEVYRARDARLNRDVAIKVLPAALASDPERLARFTREAQVLASLNHPNIATIYGLERQDRADGSGTCIVMELVEGPTLAERLQTSHPGRQHAMPLDDALPIARQIADALEAAHEQGIIHRDLKPANVKVRDDGTVKVLDFGLAKIAETSGSGLQTRDATRSPTITTPAMTATGIILGTAAYMSPEQAKGKPADRRSDIWAFGCVLYEMLTGRRPFDGDDVAEVLASVLAKEPDWSQLPSNLSPALGIYLRRCLHKNPKQRIAGVQDLRLALEGAFDAAIVESGGRAVPRWRTVALAATAAAAILAVVVSVLLVRYDRRPAASAPTRVARLQLPLSGAAALTLAAGPPHITITPDGSRVVYVGNRGTQLFVRALDTLEPVAVFTGFPRDPFVSPDSQWIGFVDQAMLKKVAATGGPAIPIARIDGPTSRGVTWGSDDTIIFATTNGSTGLQRVAASGGTTRVLTRADVEQGEADHAWPQWLPGGRAVLFTITAANGGPDASQIAVLDLQTGTRTVLVHGGSNAYYVASNAGASSSAQEGDGYILYATTGTLRAVPFDLTQLRTRGTPVAVVRDVVTTAIGAVDAAVANDGTLAYVSGGPAVEPAHTLVWVDRRGRETSIPAPPRGYVHPRLSPDGTRVAVFVADQELDLWLTDVTRPPLTRITSGPGADSSPVWSLDGQRLIFTSQRSSVGNLFMQALDGSRAVQRLTDSPNRQLPTAISPDGRSLIFTESTVKTADDVMQMALDGTRRITPLIQSPFAERNGIVSPDGRWLAYEANNSGRFEIYVRPFSDPSGGLAQVSTAGGTRPLWSRNSRELIYVSVTGGLMHVEVARGPTWAASMPTPLVKDGYFTSPGNTGRTYDISRDGQRLLMIRNEGEDPTAAPRSLIVVLNWIDELKRLVPTR